MQKATRKTKIMQPTTIPAILPPLRSELVGPLEGGGGVVIVVVDEVSEVLEMVGGTRVYVCD